MVEIERRIDPHFFFFFVVVVVVVLLLFRQTRKYTDSFGVGVAYG